MSEKMTCPGCDARLSSVLYAFQNGDPCPVCGLSAAAALEIQSVRNVQADSRLKERLEKAITERDAAQRERDWAKTRLAHVEGELDELLSRLRKPLEDEAPPRQDW